MKVHKNRDQIVYDFSRAVAAARGLALAGPAAQNRGNRVLSMNELPISAAPGDTIASDLERAVLEHRLPPGTKLGEDELSEIYGVSRTLTRAALQALAHRHIVELRRNRGAFVAQPSARDAREVFEARLLLEPRTARAAAGCASHAEIEDLRRHIRGEHAALDAGDGGRALFLSGEFHIAIARIADQATVAGFISELIARSSLIIALYWQRRAALCESQAHDALIEALAAGDGAAAEALMRAHLEDLAGSLDLTRAAPPPGSLREALGR